MSNQMKPQCACQPPFHPRSPDWVQSLARNSPKEFAWLALSGAVPESDSRLRRLRSAGCDVRRQYPFVDGSASLLVRASAPEIARLIRCIERGEPPEGLVANLWRGALPLPAELAARQPVAEDRYLEIIAYEPGCAKPRADLLRIVSVDAALNLSLAERKPMQLGVSIALSGVGRADAVGAIEELHAAGLLPSRDRASMVKVLASSDQAQSVSPESRSEGLHIHIDESLPRQLSRVVDGIVGVIGPDAEIRSANRAPRPGKPLGAEIVVAYRPRDAAARKHIEQHVRRVCDESGMRWAWAGWLIDGVMHSI